MGNPKEEGKNHVGDHRISRVKGKMTSQGNGKGRKMALS